MQTNGSQPTPPRPHLVEPVAHRSTYHGGCLPSALELFCGLVTARSEKADAFPDLQQQAILFVNGVVRNPGYRGRTAAGVTLTPAAREQVQRAVLLHSRKVSTNVLAAL